MNRKLTVGFPAGSRWSVYIIPKSSQRLVQRCPCIWLANLKLSLTETADCIVIQAYNAEMKQFEDPPDNVRNTTVTKVSCYFVDILSMHALLTWLYYIGYGADGASLDRCALTNSKSTSWLYEAKFRAVLVAEMCYIVVRQGQLQKNIRMIRMNRNEDDKMDKWWQVTICWAKI